MSSLSSAILQRARDGDINALVTMHEFCKEGNVRNESTFKTILTIVLHKFRPKLHPRLSSTLTFPRAARPWLHAATVCIIILTEPHLGDAHDVALLRQLFSTVPTFLHSYLAVHLGRNRPVHHG